MVLSQEWIKAVSSANVHFFKTEAKLAQKDAIF